VPLTSPADVLSVKEYQVFPCNACQNTALHQGEGTLVDVDVGGGGGGGGADDDNHASTHLLQVIFVSDHVSISILDSWLLFLS
jgi:hypothetical protein